MAPWIVGLRLCQIGEFLFVLGRSGITSGVLTKPIYKLALSGTILTMALSPLIATASVPLARFSLARRKIPAISSD